MIGGMENTAPGLPQSLPAPKDGAYSDTIGTIWKIFEVV